MMKSFLSFLFIGIFVFLGLSGCSTSHKGQTVILVMAATSLSDVCSELAKEYKESNSNVEIRFNFGSSGILQTQIQQGAPADIFISAAQKQMDDIEKQGLIMRDTRMDLVKNKVVLIVPKGNAKRIKGFEGIVTGKVETIGLGDFISVPAGQYAKEILESLGILKAAQKKAVYGSNVRQVLSWTERGEVDCGIVYETDAALSKGVEIICRAPEEAYKAVIYPVAVLTDSYEKQESKEFLGFLQSYESIEIFKKHGFSMVKE